MAHRWWRRPGQPESSSRRRECARGTPTSAPAPASREGLLRARLTRAPRTRLALCWPRPAASAKPAVPCSPAPLFFSRTKAKPVLAVASSPLKCLCTAPCWTALKSCEQLGVIHNCSDESKGGCQREASREGAPPGGCAGLG